MEAFENVLSTAPGRLMVNEKAAVPCIDACVAAAFACTACADACLAESQLDMLRHCVRLDMQCADICAVTARVLARAFDGEKAVFRAQVEACALACAACATECERHSHEHCARCAEACRKCETKCRDLLRTMGAAARA